MNILLVSGIILGISLVFVGFFAKRYADFWFKILVSDKAELVNEVLATEEVPAKWRLAWLERAAANRGLSWLSNMLKRWYLYRLDRLIGTLSTATYVNKDLKAEYLAALQEIKGEWQERSDLF